MLVVVEHRDVHPLPQRLLDHEAVGCGNVLEVDPAEARLEQGDGVDEPVAGRRSSSSRSIASTSAKRLNSTALPSITGFEAARRIAEAEDRGSVRDDGDEIALGRIVVGAGRVGSDRPHRDRDSGRISEAEVALGRHRLGGDDLDLPRAAARMEFERFLSENFTVASDSGASSQPPSPCGGRGLSRRAPGYALSRGARGERKWFCWTVEKTTAMARRRPTPMMPQSRRLKGGPGELCYSIGWAISSNCSSTTPRSPRAVSTLRLRSGASDGEPIPMCGVPVHRGEIVPRTADQGRPSRGDSRETESPAEARKARGSKTLVERAIVRLVTPGT